jgi:hypothetical protein
MATNTGYWQWGVLAILVAFPALKGGMELVQYIFGLFMLFLIIGRGLPSGKDVALLTVSFAELVSMFILMTGNTVLIGYLHPFILRMALGASHLQVFSLKRIIEL